MAWIKRNLYFVIGSAVALALMGMAGWFLYSKWQLNNDFMTKLNEDYAELGNLNSQKPHPGSGQVDNIKAAKEQRAEVIEFQKTVQKSFLRIPRPAGLAEVAKLTDRDVAAALSRTIFQLQRDATNASVTMPQDYSFSFQTQRPKVAFAAGSLDPIAEQLAEVKTLCDVLFRAKINSLESIRRERVSADDSAAGASQTDYLGNKSVTNELAVMTPYELTFRCFSSELASVLGGFASSPYGLIVKTINVESGAPATETTAADGGTPPSAIAPGGPPGEMEARFARRYGLGRYQPQPQPQQPAPGTTPAVAGKGGLQTVLDEKQLKVTMMLHVVKLLPAK